MNQAKPDTTKLDPNQAWPFGQSEPVSEAEQLRELAEQLGESPL